TAERRKSMGEAAVAAAKAIGYVGAGTVEFIAGASGEFYFMEMNTRLQVEHPVTELISGQDLVEWQLRVASGERLPLLQDQLVLTGHAVEARLYAEDPARNFLPATGRLTHLRFPESAPAGPVRVDTGVRAGDEVSIFYDPMIAKLIAWGPDRASALKRMAGALGECEIAGLVTNVEFLRRVVEHPEFAAGKFDTGFIARHKDALVPPRAAASDTALALAALAVELRRAQHAAAAAAQSSDPFSPWHTSVGWRLNDAGYHTLNFQDGERKLAVRVHYTHGAFMLDLPGGAAAAAGRMADDGTLDATIADRHLTARVAIDGDHIAVFVDGARTELDFVDPLHSIGDVETAQGNLTAPMSGKVIEVMVKEGARVKRGTTLLILEAMKMEHNIAAPTDGTVKAVHFGKGEQVAEGAQLIEFEPDENA
ncbi:MAG: biotin/lipoyl-containing protein, partial [Alphaproteobacteria bacterium]